MADLAPKRVRDYAAEYARRKARRAAGISPARNYRAEYQRRTNQNKVYGPPQFTKSVLAGKPKKAELSISDVRNAQKKAKNGGPRYPLLAQVWERNDPHQISLYNEAKAEDWEGDAWDELLGEYENENEDFLRNYSVRS